MNGGREVGVIKKKKKMYKIKLVKKSALLIIIRFRVTNVWEGVRMYKSQQQVRLCVPLSEKLVENYLRCGGKLFGSTTANTSTILSN